MSNFTSVLANSVNNDGAVDAGVVSVNSLSGELVLASGTGLNVSDNGSDTITFESTVEGANVGTGDGEVYKTTTTGDLQFRTLKAGTNVTIATGTNEVTINATGGGGGGGADQDLGNLTSPTAINQDLLPAANNATDLGSSTKQFRNAYVGSYLVDAGGNALIGTGDRTLRTTAGTGTWDWQNGHLNSDGSHTVKNIPDPSSAQDAATKAYVDAHSSLSGTNFTDSGTVASPAILPDGFAAYIITNSIPNVDPSVQLPNIPGGMSVQLIFRSMNGFDAQIFPAGSGSVQNLSAGTTVVGAPSITIPTSTVTDLILTIVSFDDLAPDNVIGFRANT